MSAVDALSMLTRGLMGGGTRGMLTRGLLADSIPGPVEVAERELVVDAALLFEAESFRSQFAGDVEIADGDLVRERGLVTAVFLSLFCDRRADDEELARFGGSDPRGFWGDVLAEVEEDELGSKLWLLLREKETEETANRAREYTRESLAWLVEDGIAEQVDVATEWLDRGLLGVGIAIAKPDSPAERFAFVWEAQG